MNEPATHATTASASVRTETPGGYIAQLCKHFAHRIERFAWREPPTLTWG